nr:OprD family porin [Pseudomonas eucalypticola]
MEDGSGSLDLRNFYFNRDYHGPLAAQSRRDEWAQGFGLKLLSGYTEGTVGIGLDAFAMLGLRLDSSPDRSGSGLLPRGSDKRAAEEYGDIALALKVRVGNSEIKAGSLIPQLPLLSANYSRLFPQTFDGVQLISRDFEHITFTLLHADRTKLRDSSGDDRLTAMPQQGAYSSTATSGSLSYLGFDFQPFRDVTLSLHESELEDMFRRGYAGFKANTTLGDGKVFTEWRYFTAQDIGRRLLGEVDNQTLSTNFGYSWAGHTISGGFQRAYGSTAYAFVGGTDTYLFSEQQISTFALAQERVWHARYDYDFAALGLPGLTFNVRYVSGTNVELSHVSTTKARRQLASGERGDEWERTSDLSYTIQSGPLKNLSVRWRNGKSHSNFSDSADEDRIILGYVYNF